MSGSEFDRREFLKVLLGGVSMVAFDWSVFPKGARARMADNEYDAVIIGSGLGGLSCAAAFARQGFRALVLEKHDRAGGYATTFKRPGGFVFDVSLHSTAVGERDGVYNVIPGFSEITDVEFVPHPVLYRSVFPEHDIRVPQRDVPTFIDLLAGHFEDEREGIQGIFEDMNGLSNDVQRFMGTGGDVDMDQLEVDFPHLARNYTRTWADMVDARIRNPKLKAVVSSLWGYYGLPPSKLASVYYALPTAGYLEYGGYYPHGKSQKISNAFVRFIEEREGTVLLKTRVKEIMIENHAAVGVLTEDGRTYKGKVVVSNANAYDTFHTMMNEDEYLADYLARMDQFSVSLSSFQVFLGLNKDLIAETGIKDTEIFYQPSYDLDAHYKAALEADVEAGMVAITLYDNLYEGYSPKGKNTLNILVLQGYDYWEKYATDYWKREKTAYIAEKERMARVLIEIAEKKLLPGLSKAIEVKEIGTPLTNIRYTNNYRGAIYGWDQTVDNSGQNRLGHKTPINNLYLTGAWTRPGHGYGGVIWSGIECFGEIMGEW
ncbi:MAG: NAD(P)/FAD-dependent oxidoreductase [Candidatus Latescibacterota bacterium]|nr:MAG: NAD(P)/FAD-dependent oxidoreductase [Candidatus Latescibacterota bacterium]